jgi:hypothetical protein
MQVTLDVSCPAPSFQIFKIMFVWLIGTASKTVPVYSPDLTPDIQQNTEDLSLEPG